MEKTTTTKRTSNRRGATTAAVSAAAGIAGVLLAAWVIYGTVTIDPFRWGVFAEELIVALCALFALRLLCVIRLPKWVSLACILALPAAIALYGALSLPEDTLSFLRALLLAAAVAFSLLLAHQLDTKPDGVLLAALLCAFCLPVLLSANTRLLDELMRALLMAGVFMVVLAVRQKTVILAYVSSVAFALAGAASLLPAFAGFGAGLGALLLSPKRKRGGWAFAMALMSALPVAVWFLSRALLPAESPLMTINPLAAGEFALVIQTHLMRALALGLFAMSVRFFFAREDAAIPALFALACFAAARLLPLEGKPDVWMDALLLSALAGVGVAKIAR